MVYVMLVTLLVCFIFETFQLHARNVKTKCQTEKKVQKDWQEAPVHSMFATMQLFQCFLGSCSTNTTQIEISKDRKSSETKCDI